MAILGPVAEAAQGGHSNAAFDLIVGSAVLAATWLGYGRRKERPRLSIWVAIGISAICAVFLVSGIKELLR